MLTPEQLRLAAEDFAEDERISHGEGKSVEWGRLLLQHITEQEAQTAVLQKACTEARDLVGNSLNWDAFPEIVRKSARQQLSALCKLAADAGPAGQPLLDRQRELEEALKPFAAFYDAWAATKYPEHLEADIDTSAIATQRFTEAGDFVNTRITYADLHRARAVLQQALRSSPMNGEQKGGEQG